MPPPTIKAGDRAGSSQPPPSSPFRLALVTSNFPDPATLSRHLWEKIKNATGLKVVSFRGNLYCNIKYTIS